MIGTLWIANLGILTLDFAIMLILISRYLKNYRGTQAKAMFGIAMFAIVFLLQAAVSIYFYYGFSTRYGVSVALPLLLINLIGLAGFSSLYYNISQ